MISVADPESPEVLTPEDFERSMYDRRAAHVPTVKVNGVRQRYTPKPRPWSEVTGITLHQTACQMGENIPRYDGIGAHFAIQRSGRILRMCDANRLVVHGHGWNNRCVGIEVDGIYGGLLDDPATMPDEALQTTWDDPTTARRETPMDVTPEATVSLRQLVRWLVHDTAAHGGKIQFLVAHRQASSDRRNDPGEAIWQAAAIPLHTELGLTDGGVGFKIGDGFAIPEAWDPTCTGTRY